MKLEAFVAKLLWMACVIAVATYVAMVVLGYEFSWYEHCICVIFSMMTFILGELLPCYNKQIKRDEHGGREDF